MEAAFYVLAFVILTCSAAVVVAPSPIHSALCLAVVMLGVSGIFALLGAHFLAVAQLIVYAGAIVVLILFVVMLLDVKKEPLKKSALPLAFLAALAAAFLVVLLVSCFDQAFGTAAARPAVPGSAAAVGGLLFREYLLAFEAASLLLIGALAGAVMLARRSRLQSSPDTRGE